MDASHRKSIEELLKMDVKSRTEYLNSLEPEERERVHREFRKAMSDRQVKALVDNLNRNVLKQREE